MAGVEILNRITVVTEYEFSWTAFWIASIITIGIIIIVGIFISIIEGPDLMGSIILLFIGVILSAFFGFICGNICETPVKYETHYQVTVDDSVPMGDFLEKYEIIDTEGKILTVRERNTE